MSMLVALFLAPAAAAMPPVGTKTNMAPTAKVECRMVTEAHSRIPTRVCRLDKEWEMIAEDAQKDMRSSRHSKASSLSQ